MTTLYKAALIFLCFSLTLSKEVFVKKTKSDLNDCVKKVIKNVYGNEETLYFLYGQAGNYVFLDELLNPRVIIDVRKPNDVLNGSIGHIQNYIIYSKHVYEAVRIIDIIVYPHILQKQIPNPTRTVFIIISKVPRINVREFFPILWRVDIINVVILTYHENSQNDLLKFYTSDPQATENHCGKSANFWNEYSCDEEKPITFPKTLRKYSNCNITFVHQDLKTINRISRIEAKFKVNIAEIIMKFLNTTPNYKTWWDDNQVIIDSFMFMIIPFQYCNNTDKCCSGIISQGDMGWVLPRAKQIPSIQVLKITFKGIVWISIFLTFIITAFFWWILSKFSSYESTNEFSLALINVFSITLFGNTSRIPVYLILRILFISYVVYSIHIQTAFTSNLIQILTMPQYEKPIQSLEELAYTDYPVISNIDSNKRLEYLTIVEDGIHKKIMTKLQIYNNEKFEELFLLDDLKNKSVYLDINFIRERIMYYKKNFYYITDNSLAGSIKYVFVTPRCTYFCHTLTKMVTLVVESGLIDKFTKKYENIVKQHININKPRDEDKVVLTLNHLIAVFVIWGIGIIIATFTFVIELLVHYVAQKLNK